MSDGTVQPDEDLDVIVHYMRVNVIPAKEHSHDTWTVWVGEQKLAECDSLDAATSFARQAGAVRNRPVWLLEKKGYPMTLLFDPSVAKLER
jgi:hypothetical protein